ncbi:hypothetical protein PV328_008351 [Microctonus aethiopoides]|uniref:Exonuclease domain-containing protein n=1 Tax=Microctonus aethiopoides TaxID=144406 RepID=A0AA39KQU1_9HYME|nr:hypothetical protein PV328_008351 [Microctonus aethiopoides]
MNLGKSKAKKVHETVKSDMTSYEKDNYKTCDGRRIVELTTLAKNLKCSQCEDMLSLEKIVKEKRIGPNSLLLIRCRKCAINTLVPTGKMHITNNNKTKADVNTKAVLGILYAGMGCTALNKLLTCLNVPTISNNLYKRYEREIGPALEAIAKESCERAAAEERQLVIDNIEELSKELPQEIVKEIYPFITALQSSLDNNDILLDENNTKDENPTKFDIAVGENKGNLIQLADALRQIPNHVFGNHDNCGQWCHRKSSDENNNGEKKTILLKDARLYNKLQQIFFKYANNAAKFSIAASSQANESMNNIMAHKAPKNRCYSLSESADFRLASAVCAKNDGEGHLLHVMTKLSISPETSGFGKNAEILQIAAKFDDNAFSVYAKPTKKICYSASKITGLHEINGSLYLRGKEVNAMLLKDALFSFQEFLNISGQPCLLVAHNATFDAGHLITAIINYSTIEEFQNIVGFTDTLLILKQMYPERCGPGLFKLNKLAEDFLSQTGDFHDALYDVEILQQLSLQFITPENLIKYKKSYVQYLGNEARSQKATSLMPSLKLLQGVVSDSMQKKMANAGIDFNMMLVASKDQENETLVQLLSGLNDMNKPRVTKDKKILKNIEDFFKNYEKSDMILNDN